jgi:geranylgeranyl reductase family protein
MIYDVLIVGAGPSGSYLAYLLSKKGFTVTLLDKESFPRDKVCGGGLSQKTVELLDFDILPIMQKKIIGSYLTYQNKDTIIKDLPYRGGAAVLRSDFDNFILEKAIGKGTKFYDKTIFQDLKYEKDHLEIRTSKTTIKCKYLIGADGVYSKVRNKLFGREIVNYTPAIEALIYLDQKIIDKIGNRVLFDFGGMPRGYGWIFPKNDHLNVGVFSIFKQKNLKAFLNEFIRNYKILNDYKMIKYKGHAIPLKNEAKIYQDRNVWLIGDAAGFAESFYGEGIYFALKSAVVASEALMSCFDNNNYNAYTRHLAKDVLIDLKYSELNAKLFYPRQKFGFYNMVRNEHVNYYFSELIAGKVGHKECFYKTIFTSPYWMFSKKITYEKNLKF